MIFTVICAAKRVTIILRDDIYQNLKEKAGARNISKEINKILLEHFEKSESMFGTMKKTDTVNLRDHNDRCR